MLRTIKIVKTLTSLFFVAILLITYAFIVNKVNVYIDLEKMTLVKVENLFFVALGAFVFFNLLFLMFDRVLMKYQNKRQKFSNLMKTTKFQVWVKGLSAAVNVFLASSVIFVGFLNSDKELKLLDYTVFLYIGPVAVLIALLTLPWVFIPEKKNVD